MSSLRVDRFLSLYLFQLLMRFYNSNYKPRIPILMYHSISDYRQKDNHPYYETSTSPRIFAEHMKFLYENNYKVINLHDIEKHFTDHFNQKAVVITFDDGFYDFYIEAFPVLERYGFSATVFLPAAFIGKERKNFMGKGCLCWGEVRELHKSGINFGSHTLNHPKLINLRKEDIETELKLSKEIIERELNSFIDAFACPYAYPEENNEFVVLLNTILKKYKYRYGVNTKIGTVKGVSNLLDLKRIPINSFDDKLLFQAKLSGAYDWLYFFQKGKKVLFKSRS